MLARFINRLGDQPLLHYEPATPGQVINKLLEIDRRLRVVIDGAGTLWEVDSLTSAQQLQKEKGVKAVSYFNQKGRFQILGDPKSAITHRGHIYSHAQARGADVRLDATLPAVLTSNRGISLEEFLQDVYFIFFNHRAHREHRERKKSASRKKASHYAKRFSSPLCALCVLGG